MSRPRQLVVFSDLDGTLLDHHSYEFEPARPAIEALRRAAIPLVLVTSKTAAEVSVLREQLGNVHPFIVENGAATVVPAGYFDPDSQPPADCDEVEVVSAGPTRSEILEIIDEVAGHGGFRFTGFAAMGPEGIARATGLPPDGAVRANQRSASEPLQWQDTEERLDAFEAKLAKHGLRCLRGGRFVSVGGQFDKGAAVRGLLERYRSRQPERRIVSIALGDGPNDLGMLACADIAVVVRGHHGHDMSLPDSANVIHTRLAGPAGWNEAMLSILESERQDQTDGN